MDENPLETDFESTIDITPTSSDETPTPPASESRARLFFKRLLRWLVGLLIIFGLGFITAIFSLFLPARQVTNQQAAALADAHQKIEELTNQLAELNGLQKKYQESLENQQKANLFISILSARVDIANAQLAMANGDTARARLSLSQTSKQLQTLEKLVETGQRKIVTDMQDRLELALAGIESNPYAAQSDLDVLANSLLELQSVYFTTP